MAWVETRVHTRIDAAGKRRQESVHLARYRDASGKGRSAGTFKRKREASEAAQRQERLVKRGGGKLYLEQHNPPRHLDPIDEADVAQVHRVIPWPELIGI